MRIPFWQRFKKTNQWAFPLTKTAETDRPWVRWVMAAVLVVGLSLLFPQSRSLKFADLKEGSISTKRIVAPFNFEILKTVEEYNRDRGLAGAEVYPLFMRDNDNSETAFRNLSRFFSDVQHAREAPAPEPERRIIQRDSLIRGYVLPGIGIQDWEVLLDPSGSVSPREWNLFKESVLRGFRDLMAVGILGLDKGKITVPDHRVLIFTNDEEMLRPVDSFYDLGEARNKFMEALNRHFSENRTLFKFGSGLVQMHLSPNLVYDENLHRQRVNEIMAKVPLSSGFVVENEKIVDQNERITPEIRKRLVSLDAKMAEKGMKSTGLKQYFPYLGKLSFVCALLFLFSVYAFMESPALLRDTKSVFLSAMVLLLVGGSAYFLRLLDASEFFVPVAVGSMLLATLFDERVGFAGTMVMGFLVGGIWGNEFALSVVSVFTGVVGVLVIKRVRNRSQILRAVLVMAAVYVFAITVTGLLAYFSPKEIVRTWWSGALMGLFTPILAYGFLAIVESVFDVTTDFSLLELSNLNHPLLKRLSVEASGTYHHSILVGNLAEAAAQAVGANSLLARVGSYYHDVGKIDKAEYFVENQPRGQNPHRRLAPRMSALILSSHVKMGAELAEEYKLPSTIQDIIVQHHGRTLMSLFYQKALAKNGEEEVQEEDYRYPGPRPRTKEAAIVMLADAVEAASRSLKQPNYSRLKGLIEHLVDERFKAGELDRAPVTLRDLESIKENFLTIMAGTFHARVEYPEPEDKKSAEPAKPEGV
jgi:cyclic-di-AMP phosphodiesterase PgpH